MCIYVCIIIVGVCLGVQPDPSPVVQKTRVGFFVLVGVFTCVFIVFGVYVAVTRRRRSRHEEEYIIRRRRRHRRNLPKWLVGFVCVYICIAIIGVGVGLPENASPDLRKTRIAFFVLLSVFGCVIDVNSVARTALRLDPPGRRPRGRPKKRRMDRINEDMTIVGAAPEDALDRNKWKRLCRHADPAIARD